MTEEQKKHITKISQQFAGGFKDIPLNGSGWLIVDPLSGFLEMEGYKNKVMQMPANENRPQVLIIEFPDGSMFIPAGEDLAKEQEGMTNWLWID